MESKALILLMWRGARLLVVGFLLGAALGFAASRIQTPVYEAKTQVLISRARLQTNTDMLPLGEEQLVSTNIQLVKSRPVLDAASAQLGIKVKADNIAVSAVPNTLIVQIKVQDPDAGRAAEIANTLVQVLIWQNETLVSERYTAFETSLNEQIAQIQTQISDLQNRIDQISDASVAEQLTQINQQIEQIRSEMVLLENEINSYPAILSEMQRLTLSEKQARLEQLRSLMDIYQQIQTNLTFIGKPGQTGLGREDPRLSSLQSTLDLYQELYLNLINSRETMSLDRMQNTPNLTQINPAVPPKEPVRPLPLLYILLGSVVGLFLAATAILTLDHLDESLKTIAQAEEALHLPVLGSISDSYDASRGLVTLHDPASDNAEAFRTMRTNVEFAVREKTIRTLLVLHADPAERKTTIAANLSIIHARQGKRVILLDGDLRRPYLHRLFGVENKTGLANLLEEDMDLQRASYFADAAAGITLIPSGKIKEDFILLHNGETWQELFLKLQKQADLIMIDGPSIETASASLLASKVDVVLLLIHQGKTQIESATTALRQLQFVSANVAGIVMYRASTYRRIQLNHFHWRRVNKKGGIQEPGNKLDEETIAVS